MIFDGTDTVYITWGYVPITTPAIKWIRVADGNYKGKDLGTNYDVFESDIVFKGPESELSDLEDHLHNNRYNLSVQFSSGEEVFGADVNHALFDAGVGDTKCTVVNYGAIQRVSFGQFTFPLRLRVSYIPTDEQGSFFTGFASISSLRLSGYTYQAGSEFDLMRIFPYKNQPDLDHFAVDGGTDPGIFIGNFTQTNDEMKAIRRYLLTTARSNTLSSFDFSAFGVSEPFGQRMGTGPFNVKIIDWKDLGRVNYVDWGLQITFARVF